MEGGKVLLPKEGKPADSPLTYRPICLLDEADKMLEKIIADRLVRHLSRDGPNLNEGQYGFRQGRSTIDAILRVRSLSESIATDGGVSMSRDTANAFNFLPWEFIERTLQFHSVPSYLVAIVGDYFRGRKLVYMDRDACEREMSCGVHKAPF